MSALSNNDFRKLLQTPLRQAPSDSGASEGGEKDKVVTYSKLSEAEKLKHLKNEVRKEDNRKKSIIMNKKKKRNTYDGKVESTVPGKKPKYRDRAKERREGKNQEEYMMQMDDLPVFSDRYDPKAETLRKIEQMQYMHQDLAFTPQLPLPTAPQYEMKGVLTDSVTPPTGGRGRGDRMGPKIWEAIQLTKQPHLKPKLSHFVVERQAYVFDIEPKLGGDIPTTLIRSREEAPLTNKETKYQLSSNVVTLMQQIMSGMKQHSHNQPARKKIHQFDESDLPPLVTVQPRPDSMDTDNNNDDDDDDLIFPDAPEYNPVPDVSTTTTTTTSFPAFSKLPTPENNAPASHSYFKTKANTDIVESESKSDIAQFVSPELMKKMEQTSKIDFSTITDEKLEKAERIQQSIEKEQFYEECYGNNDTLASYSRVVYNSDSDEEDVSVTSTGKLRRWVSTTTTTIPVNDGSQSKESGAPKKRKRRKKPAVQV